MLQDYQDKYMEISIHAPTRGATHTEVLRMIDIRFQSTLPREERPRRMIRTIRRSYFNPRSHERSDRAPNGRRKHHGNFNPRSHERSDMEDYHVEMPEKISIHAPTRGATAILHKKFVYFYTIPTINI